MTQNIHSGNLVAVQKTTRYRSDIQGLRGLAVALVIFEHAGGFVSGGFVGVDVFFVISGFVITEQLLGSINSDNISLVDFYSRRARRLLPAASLVIVVTLLLSLVVLSPGLEHQKAVSAGLASAFFFPNLRYVFESGYFFLSADPFRHFWSLGVEEQFYLLYPAIVISLHRLAKQNSERFIRNLTIFIVIVCVTSLAFSSFLAFGFRLTPLPTRVAFFGTPFRAWEFLVGAGVSIAGPFLQTQNRKQVFLFIGLFGMSAILWSAFTYDEFTLFPGVAAIPPVLGATAVIIAGTTENKLSLALCCKPLTFIGDISYGLYLWHWPLIVFSKRLWPESNEAIWISVVVAVLMSVFQFRYFENPIRKNERIRGRNAALLALCSTATVTLVSFGFIRASGTGLGLDNDPIFERPFSLGSNCTYEKDWKSVLDRCGEVGSSNERLLLVGDSQAAAISDGFVFAARSLGASYSMITSNSCPVHSQPNELREMCDEFHLDMQNIAKYYKPTVVVVANAADLYITRGGFGKPDTLIRNSSGEIPKNYQEALDGWVEGVFVALDGEWFSNTKIVYVHMSPNAPLVQTSVLKQNSKNVKFQLKSQFDRAEIVLMEKRQLERLGNVTLFDPATTLCPSGLCQTRSLEGPIYADEYHLNSRGAALLQGALRETILVQFSK